MHFQYVIIAGSDKYQEDAAQILFSAFHGKGKGAWETIESARDEVNECIVDPFICIGMMVDGELVGWCGLRPMYDLTWELHPMVIDPSQQGRGFGALLLSRVEYIASNNGLIGIILGTDDESSGTSISMTDLNESNIYQEMRDIKNIKHHPFEFYKKCGYLIVGIVPNANGRRKPDIWMWKNLEK